MYWLLATGDVLDEEFALVIRLLAEIPATELVEVPHTVLHSIKVYY